MVRAPFTTRKCDHAHSAANTNSEVRKNFLKRSGGLRLRSGYALPEPEAAAAPSLILIVAECCGRNAGYPVGWGTGARIRRWRVSIPALSVAEWEHSSTIDHVSSRPP